jgi:FADH2 O2-dependent halogenase
MMKVDVAVLGSGFGGSLCALIAARIGLDAVLVDRATHPRFAIGESSTPSADVILRDLADRYDLPRLRPFTTWGSWQCAYPHVLGGRKRGFSYFRHVRGAAFEPDPEHGNALLVAASETDERSDTQWYRADVDAFFAAEVRRASIPFLEGIEVYPVPAGGRWRLEGTDIEAAFLIDATGSGGALAHRMEGTDAAATRSPSSRTRTRAVYGHFTGVPRWRDVVAARGARIEDYPFDPDWSALHHVLDGGWMWMLRFENDVVSAGLVLDVRRHAHGASVSPESEWRQHLACYPTLDTLFAGARPVRPPGGLIATPRLQRRVGKAAGANWAMLPHTAGFVDPLHSTGIAHTMSGIERLMEILEERWGRNDFSHALDAYQRDVLREIDLIDRLVYPCYQSTDSFRHWTASTMLYFAAATSYERLRAAGNVRAFLLADDAELSRIADEASIRLHAQVDAGVYESWLEEALQPFNHVGLFRPRIKNMYTYTAASK